MLMIPDRWKRKAFCPLLKDFSTELRAILISGTLINLLFFIISNKSISQHHHNSLVLPLLIVPLLRLQPIFLQQVQQVFAFLEDLLLEVGQLSLLDLALQEFRGDLELVFAYFLGFKVGHVGVDIFESFFRLFGVNARSIILETCCVVYVIDV